MTPTAAFRKLLRREAELAPANEKRLSPRGQGTD